MYKLPVDAAGPILICMPGMLMCCTTAFEEAEDSLANTLAKRLLEFDREGLLVVGGGGGGAWCCCWWWWLWLLLSAARAAAHIDTDACMAVGDDGDDWAFC